jgi:hypothetical protein
VEHIFEWLSREWPHRHEHRQAAEPATSTEDAMALKEIAEDIRTHITSADAWLAKVVEEHVPAILAVAEKYQNSPIVQALETAVLPPETEQQIAALITSLAKSFPVQHSGPVVVPAEAAAGAAVAVEPPGEPA